MYLKNFLRSRHLKLSIIGSMAMLGVTVSEIPVARSAAIGCVPSGFGGALSILDISSAYTCLEIGGQGLKVTSFNAYWGGVGTVCNYQFKVRWYDGGGKLYRTDASPYTTGCAKGGAKYQVIYADYNGNGAVTRRVGKVCNELYESGQLRDGIPCIYISP